MIGVVASSGLASYHELQTVYGVEALYDLLEIAQVSDYNRKIASEPL